LINPARSEKVIAVSSIAFKQLVESTTYSSNLAPFIKAQTTSSKLFGAFPATDAAIRSDKSINLNFIYYYKG